MVVHIFHLKTFVIDLLVRQIILDSLVSSILVRCNLYYLYSEILLLYVNLIDTWLLLCREVSHLGN